MDKGGINNGNNDNNNTNGKKWRWNHLSRLVCESDRST